MHGLIVGGDDIEQLKQEMAAFGLTRIDHWQGRKPGTVRRELPGGLDLLVVVWDCLNHGLTARIKQQAARHRCDVIYCRRSLGDIRAKLQALRPTGAGDAVRASGR